MISLSVQNERTKRYKPENLKHRKILTQIRDERVSDLFSYRFIPLHIKTTTQTRYVFILANEKKVTSKTF